ncbi:MAG: SAM-dependent methyltransferase [Limisphaerales bacterium]
MLSLDAPEKYVSRGGHKLEHALSYFQLDVAGLAALDLGASTGGFTDCLVQRGVSKVFAVDVGQGQLACGNCAATNGWSSWKKPMPGHLKIEQIAPAVRVGRPGRD